MSEKPEGMDIFEYSDFLGRRLWGEGSEETPEDLPEELSVNNDVRDVGSLELNDLKAFCEVLKKEKHLTYSESFVRRFIAAVQAKKFVVLTGLSGSGKTQLAMAFCEWMTINVGVAAVPGSSFFREPVNHLIRFHFAKKDETLKAALDRLSTINKLKR